MIITIRTLNTAWKHVKLTSMFSLLIHAVPFHDEVLNVIGWRQSSTRYWHWQKPIEVSLTLAKDAPRLHLFRPDWLEKDLEFFLYFLFLYHYCDEQQKRCNRTFSLLRVLQQCPLALNHALLDSISRHPCAPTCQRFQSYTEICYIRPAEKHVFAG